MDSGELARLRGTLTADCGRCAGLCCVALPFTASADFAFDKPAGQPCRHLTGDFSCGVHSRLRESGLSGCEVYECFGAGQKVTQLTFGGADWRKDPATARAMFATLPIMRLLNELLWYLTEAISLLRSGELASELQQALQATQALTDDSADALVAVDVDVHRDSVNRLLLAASEELRSEVPGARRDLRGADLVGARLAGEDLRGSSLRGALLVGADLRGADLRRADLIGADLRGANLSRADLTGALFLTRSQLTAARGDAATILPASVTPPTHWTPTAE